MKKEFIEKVSLNNTEGWRITSENISLFVTEEGAQIAPVTFQVDGKAIEPYHLTPWQDEDRTGMTGALKNLRGEFFCMPFGGGLPFNDEKHPGHGEVSGDKWHLISADSENGMTKVELGITTKVRPADVTKTILIDDRHSVLYFSHKIENASGPMALGHHPIVKMPGKGERMFLSSSKFDLGMTCPGIFSNPEKEAYQILDRGAEFDTIERIPSLTRDSETLDYSIFPSPYGFTDLFTLYKKPAFNPAWVVAVYPESGYLWFALKDSAVLPATSFWVSNSGRFFAPWNGRTYCIGIEDTCSFFANGLKDSAEPNYINERGFPTTIDLSKNPDIRHIQGVASIPNDYGKVADVQFEGTRITFVDVRGKRISVPVNYKYVMGEKI